MFKKLMDFLRQAEQNQALKEVIEGRVHKRFVPSFQLDLWVNEVKSEILDISPAGGLKVHMDQEVPLPEHDIELVFSRLEVYFREKADRVWQEGKHAGLLIRKPGGDYSSFIREVLTPQFLGESLYEIDPGVLAETGEEKLRWWQGSGDTNLFLWEVGENVSQMQILFMDFVVEWRRDKMIRTGELSGDVPKPGFGRVDPHFIVFYNIPRLEVLENALTLVRASRIESGIKDFILEELLKVERRLMMRFPVKNVFFEAGGRQHRISEISYSGFRLEQDCGLKEGQALLDFRDEGFKCVIIFSAVHYSLEKVGYSIDEISEGREEFVSFLRKLATASDS